MEAREGSIVTSAPPESCPEAVIAPQGILSNKKERKLVENGHGQMRPLLGWATYA